MKFYLLVFGVGILYLFSGCAGHNPQKESKPVPPIQNIYHYIRYEAPANRVQAQVSFKTDSAKTDAVVQVVVNDKKTRKLNLPEVGTQFRFFGERMGCLENYSYEYLFDNDEVMEDSVKAVCLADFEVGNSKISKKEGGILAWEGPAATDKDAILLHIVDGAGVLHRVNHMGKTNQSQLTILPIQIPDLAPGKGSLSLIWKRKNSRKIGSKLTVFEEIEFYTKPYDIEIVEALQPQ